MHLQGYERGDTTSRFFTYRGRVWSLLSAISEGSLYNKNEALIFKKYQNSLKTKLPMPSKKCPLRTTTNAIFWFFSKAWAPKTIVFDVQLSIWQLRSCSKDGVKDVLLISH